MSHVRRSVRRTQTADAYPIPVATNLATAAICAVLYCVLLYAGSHASTTRAIVGYGALFAVVLIPVYSLIHEAEHMMLVPDPAWNDRLGRWLCLLFIAPYTFFKHCHLRHHTKNRTDIEMWDLYLEHQQAWKRYGNLYLMMMGLGAFSLWVAVIGYALAPKVAYCGILQRHTEIAGFLEGSNQPEKIRAMRRESWLVILFQAILFVALGLHLRAWLIMFAIHGFVWSSQNYVNHAFSPRDIIDGAHNLTMPVWLNPVYMNFNLHLAHHQDPRIPWVHLPQFVRSGPGRISFFRNYLRLWKGPRLTREPSPVLHRTPAM